MKFYILPVNRLYLNSTGVRTGQSWSHKDSEKCQERQTRSDFYVLDGDLILRSGAVRASGDLPKTGHRIPLLVPAGGSGIHALPPG